MSAGRAVATLLVLLSSVSAFARTLVLTDNADVRHTHSLFFEDLRQAGHDLNFLQISDDKLRLQNYGEWLYDSIVLFSRSAKQLGGAVDVHYLTQFVDSGRNLLIASDAGSSEAIRELSSKLGVDFLDPAARLTDHVSHSRDHGPQDVLTSVFDVPAIVGAVSGPLRYRGGGLMTPADSLLAFHAVLAAPTSQSLAAGRPAKHASGSAIALAVGVQALNDARVLVTGSLSMFSDDFFSTPVVPALTPAAPATPPANRALCAELAAWALQSKSMLTASNFRHRRTRDAAPPPGNTYTVRDEIIIEVDLHETRSDGGDPAPHVSDSVRLQYVMLDPYIRQHMVHEGGGHYALTVTAPDVYGTFKWVLDVHQKGYSRVHLEEVAPLRPFRHDQYPRFVVQAYPYYATVACLSVAFFVLITLVMFHDDAPKGKSE